MTSPPCQQRIRLHILLNISRIKGKQTMKFSQLIEYNKRRFFLENHLENETERLVLDLFLSFKKGFI